MKSQTEHVADGAKGIKRGEFKSSVSKDRSKPKGKVAEKVKPEKPSAPREPPKKIHRIVIRKLPAREFSEADVQQCLDRVCSTGDIGLIRDAFTLEHFVAGKIR